MEVDSDGESRSPIGEAGKPAQGDIPPCKPPCKIAEAVNSHGGATSAEVTDPALSYLTSGECDVLTEARAVRAASPGWTTVLRKGGHGLSTTQSLPGVTRRGDNATSFVTTATLTPLMSIDVSSHYTSTAESLATSSGSGGETPTSTVIFHRIRTLAKKTPQRPRLSSVAGGSSGPLDPWTLLPRSHLPRPTLVVQGR